MNLGKKGVDLIIEFETGNNIEKYLTAYQDSVGVWTIGIGNTYYEDGSRVKRGDRITKDRAISLFSSIIKNYEKDVNRLVKVQLTQNQFDALVSFTYNLGATNLSKSTLLRKLNANPCDTSIPSEFLKWNKAGGKVLKGLTRRREAEAKLFSTK